MATYQGHRSWNAWNVNLHISEDRQLANKAFAMLLAHGVQEAAKRIFELTGKRLTPEGGKFNLRCIREALQNMYDNHHAND